MNQGIEIGVWSNRRSKGLVSCVINRSKAIKIAPISGLEIKQSFLDERIERISVLTDPRSVQRKRGRNGTLRYGQRSPAGIQILSLLQKKVTFYPVPATWLEFRARDENVNFSHLAVRGQATKSVNRVVQTFDYLK
jgi:hypothetical protein